MPFSEELIAFLSLVDARQVLLAHEHAQNAVGFLVAEFYSCETSRGRHLRLTFKFLEVQLASMFGLELSVCGEVEISSHD